MRVALIFTLFTIMLAAPGLSRAAEPELAEVSLPPAINPTQTFLREANTGMDGRLYISDYEDGGVWRIEPFSGVYQQYLYYQTLMGIDAQPAPDGSVWYADFENKIGYFNPGLCNSEGCPGKEWTLPKDTLGNLYNLGAIAPDAQGRIWAGVRNSSADPLLFSLKPATNQLCTYDFNDYTTEDLRYYDGYLWLGDSLNGRILRLTLTAEGVQNITVWQLPGIPKPKVRGLAFDAHGALWWAEDDYHRIGHLLPDATGENLAYFTVPDEGSPWMLAAVGDVIIYTDQAGIAGVLDTQTANPTVSMRVEPGPVTFTSICETLAPSYIGNTGFLVSSGVLGFGELTVAADSSNHGWLLYDIPDDPGDDPEDPIDDIPSSLYGAAATRNLAWLTDPGRGKLVRFTFEETYQYTYLPLILH